MPPTNVAKRRLRLPLKKRLHELLAQKALPLSPFPIFDLKNPELFRSGEPLASYADKNNSLLDNDSFSPTVVPSPASTMIGEDNPYGLPKGLPLEEYRTDPI